MRRLGPGVAVVVATTVDVGGLLVLRAATGWPVAAADAMALAVAAPLSYVLHRATDRGADPFVRWVRDPARFARVAVVAGLVDVAVLQILVVLVGDPALPALFGLKLVAVAIAAMVRIVGHRRILLRAVQADQSAPRARPPSPGDRRLTVVLPSYHQADVVGDAVRRVREALAPSLGAEDVEIVVVDDGSGDDTAARADAGGADRVVVHPANRGKGAAVRSGAAVARGRTIAFTDADLAYDPAQLLVLLERVETGWDVAVGSRRHTDAVTLVRARRLREVGGRFINLLSQAVLLGHYRDTQCGLKGFRSDVAPIVLGQGLIDGFAFDIELFHLVERNGVTLTEVPVQVANSERSSVQVVRDGIRLVRDLFRIRRYAAAGRYSSDARLPDPAPGEPGSVG
jgi:dolichyl-phosphate beta-glucosyltransferase